MDKEKIKKVLQRAFALYSRTMEALSERWREHSNRRTIIVILIVGTVAIYSYQQIVRPPDNFPVDELVTVSHGASLVDASLELEASGVVRSARALRLLVTLLGHQKSVHAGDYLFKEPRDIFSVARAISIGAYGLEPIRIRIPEGATTKEMALFFSGHLQRFNSAHFLSEARPIEGHLFPDTYFFLPNANEDLVMRTLKQNFDAHIATIDPQIQSFGKPLSDVVIIASLLEREAHSTEDRRMIAGVLWNRLSKGMLLQVDAAFLYTLGKGSFQLTNNDLSSDSPYNTYKYKGLPPTAIGSPSMDSILAAVTPIKHNYLYYLADRNGVTHYSKTYAEHLRKKQLYLN